ncbi:class F sortase [Streptomyces sp. NPDC018693]|uniref:class F sortase n=1 Tax=unclassified Streptomyces TaxID=2593676 RepID=UPI0037ACDC22
MTSLSRRGFGIAALTATGALVAVGCGGADAGAPPARRRRAPSDTSPSGDSRAATPVGLRIPAIGVDTPVIPLGLAPDGTVEVPPITEDDPAGWYRHSPVPGRTGPSVILGHVTVGPHGDGVFRHLGRLRPGDGILTRLDSGGAPEFTVTSVRTVAKADFPTDQVYGDVDRPELRLITCGGPRTGGDGTGGYRDNVIVFAAVR